MKKIVLSGSINETFCQRLFPDLIEWEADENVQEITIYLTSNGGQSDVALGVCDFLKAFPKPITIVAAGVCHSAAVTILQMADKRLALPNTHFMIHPMSILESMETSVFQIAQDSEYFQRIEKKKLEIIGARTGMLPEKIQELYKNKLYFSAQEARNFGPNGLIDAIVEPF